MPREGLSRATPTSSVEGPRGEKIWDTASYAFVQGDAPASVNPSLWRQAKLNGLHGLFEVIRASTRFAATTSRT